MAKIKIRYKEAKEYEEKGIIRITEKYRHIKHKDDDIVEAVTIEDKKDQFIQA